MIKRLLFFLTLSVFSITVSSQDWAQYNVGNSSFLTVDFANENFGLAGGGDTFGFVQKTFDGGKTWSSSLYDGQQPVTSIDVVSANEAFLVNTADDLYYTSNSGGHWTRIYEFGGQIESIHFVDNQIGYVAFQNEIYKTTDGGNNWSQSTGLLEKNIKKIYFPSQNVGYAIFEDSKIIKTTDGGSNWTVSSEISTRSFYDIHFFDDNNGYISGDNIVLKTTNGGTSWQTITPTNPSNNLFKSIFFTSENIGFVGADRILKTTDGGTNWVEMSVTENPSVNDLYFVNSGLGFAACNNATIMRYDTYDNSIYPDYDALVALYNSTDGTNWKTKWNINTPVNTWHGIVLDETTNRVTRLTLENNDLYGTLPSEIGSLTSLEKLSIYSNFNLSGSIPSEIGNLVNLNEIALYSNSLSGNIPNEIGNLIKLTRLNLSQNQLSGSIPTELGNLTMLFALELNNNNLTNAIPSEIGGLSNLFALYLHNNELTEQLPNSFVNLNNLGYLSLYNNNLSGAIPDLTSLTSLLQLIINDNNFIFKDFETQFTQYQNLNTFTYSPQNKFDEVREEYIITGESFTLTSETFGETVTNSANNSYQWYKDGLAIDGATNKTYSIVSMSSSDAGVYVLKVTNSNVTNLELEQNNLTLNYILDNTAHPDYAALKALYDNTNGASWTNTWNLNSSIENWYGITLNARNRVSQVNLFSNNLVGTLPSELANLTDLVDLRLYNNELTGNIPVELGQLSNLIDLNLSGNQLSGNIPSELSGLSNLEQLNLFDNLLNGTIPNGLGNLNKLVNLNFYKNQLDGTIPAEIGNLSNLQILSLSSNNLIGTIPSEIGSLTQLITLSLNSNGLTGTIPSSLGNLTSLTHLNLYGNSLEGTIPNELSNLTKLINFGINNNNFTGEIPSWIINFSDLENLYLNNNNLSGSIVDLGSLTNLKLLKIENNNFIFKDFETEFLNYKNLDVFTYSPQNKFNNQEALTRSNGNNITLSSIFNSNNPSTNNSYQWYKDGSVISGATGSSYTIVNADDSDTGNYTLKVNNSIITDLELERNLLNLTVNIGTNRSIWNGDVNSSWSVADNWDSGTVPLSTDDLIVPNVATTPNITSNIQMNDLTVESLSSFDVSETGSVTVDGDLINDGTFTMVSTASNSSSLLVKGTSNGAVTYERGGLLANKWSIISAPVSGQKIKEFVENTANNIRINTSTTPHRYAVSYYDDSQPSGSKWVYFDVDYLAANSNETFEKGRSYAISRGTDGVVSFTGTIETTDTPKTVTASEWNAIGNPYTAFLSINENSGTNFINDNLASFDPAYVGAYVWDNSQNKYVAKTLLSGESSLAPSQGFFVRTNVGISSIDFKEAQRKVQPATGGTFNRGAINNISAIELSIASKEVKVNTTISFRNNVTKGLDAGYDVGNYDGSELDIYTRLVDASSTKNFTYQSLPKGEHELFVIPVGIKAKEGASVTISAIGTGLEGMEVYLEDKELNKFINLIEEDYQIEASNLENNVGRFYLHAKAPIEVPEVTIDDIKIYNSNRKLFVAGIYGEQFEITMYNILGSVVYQGSFEGLGNNELDLPVVETGVYVVKVQTGLGVKEKKIILKK